MFLVLSVLMSLSVAPGVSERPATVSAPLVLGEPAPTDSGSAERVAVAAVNAYWQREFPELGHRAYSPPRVTGSYQGTAGPSCDGQPSQAMNAFYCDDGDFLAWDEGLMTTGFRQVGASWVYLIIAHEWGHAIQARLRHREVSVAMELQADCFAGAALAGAQQSGLLALPSDASSQLGRTLTENADRYPWTKSSDHGNASQRIGAFNTGVRAGPTACLGGDAPSDG